LRASGGMYSAEAIRLFKVITNNVRQKYALLSMKTLTRGSRSWRYRTSGASKPVILATRRQSTMFYRIHEP
jgi:hypothetical protein